MIGDIPGGPGRPVSDPDDALTRAIVLVWQDGLRSIVGRSGVQPADMLAWRGERGDETYFSLVRVTPGMYLYREIVPPKTGKLGEFHPSQV